MTTQDEAPIDLFEKVDFEAWNGPDWDLFRKLHTDDVIVDMFGDHPEGIDAHVKACQAHQSWNPPSAWPRATGLVSSRSPRAMCILSPLPSGATARSPRNTSWGSSRRR